MMMIINVTIDDFGLTYPQVQMLIMSTQSALCK